MSNLLTRRFCISVVISIFCITTFSNNANALMGSTSLLARSGMTSKAITRVPSVCDATKSNYGYNCSVSEIQAILQPLQARLADIEAKYKTLVSSNVELLCSPELGEFSGDFGSQQMFGPCLNYDDWDSKLHTLFFPCSNPNSRFEQVFPSEYWVGYYESVNRSQNYGGCADHYFASDVGLSYKFLNTWQRRWALVFPSYKSFMTDYNNLQGEIKTVTSELDKAKWTPTHKTGDCQLNQMDPTLGFLAKGKTSVDKYGYKFTCTNSGIRRTGRVAQIAASLSCPEYNSPTGNTCLVTSTWGINSYLSNLPKYSPKGKVIDNGWYISLTGFQCTVSLYANFAFREKCR